VLTGPVTWTRCRGETTSRISLTTDLSDAGRPVARLSYSVSGVPFEYPVHLTTTRPHYGGTRWWFLCPLSRYGRPCGRRVRKLYLGGRYFGCRDCHDLTYRSRQEHDPRVSRLMNNPALLRAVLDGGGPVSPLLAIKAAFNLEQQVLRH
jgi:hypothetical protein